MTKLRYSMKETVKSSRKKNLKILGDNHNGAKIQIINTILTLF